MSLTEHGDGPEMLPPHFHEHFHERLAVLEQALPTASEAIRPILKKVHRTARSLHSMLESIDVAPPRPTALYTHISCFDCGTRKMEVFHTSKQGGYHICPTCFDHRARNGRARTSH